MTDMEVLLTEDAERIIAGLVKGRKADPARAKKVRKAIDFLAADASHPSLHTHRYENLDAVFGVKIWESYIENKTPASWRMWWFFGPGTDQITVVDLGPHP